MTLNPEPFPLNESIYVQFKMANVIVSTNLLIC
jgi:hypothetical protein